MTVETNLVENLRDISAQDPYVEIAPSDFQDELGSTVVVKKRTKGSQLEPAFLRKARKIIKETDSPHYCNNT